MISGLKIVTNIKAFKSNIMMLKAHVKGATLSGMHNAMIVFKDDALNEIPRCPYRTGWLRDHHKIIVKALPGAVMGILRTYDTPYAAAVHEGIRAGSREFQYKTPGTGAKWIEAKMIRHHMKYIRIATDELHKKPS